MTKSKLHNDLSFIAKFQEFCKAKDYRMVVYGGYGLDGFYQKITREHGDSDLVIYGQTDRVNASLSITSFITTLLPQSTIKQINSPFQSEFKVKDSGFSLDLYYVQTQDHPLLNIHTVVKENGEIVANDPKVFPPPEKGNLGKLEIEVQNQGSHFKDILAKGGATEPKYERDLKLLYPLFIET